MLDCKLKYPPEPNPHQKANPMIPLELVAYGQTNKFDKRIESSARAHEVKFYSGRQKVSVFSWW
jgi:hypothetical protein